IVADEVAGRGAPVGEGDLEAVRALDDVAVGEDVAVGREDEARAAAGLGEALPALLAVVVDLHHRRGDARCDRGDDARIGVESFLFRGKPERVRSVHGIRPTVRTSPYSRKTSTDKPQEFSDISQRYAQVFRLSSG